ASPKGMACDGVTALVLAAAGGSYCIGTLAMRQRQRFPALGSDSCGLAFSRLESIARPGRVGIGMADAVISRLVSLRNLAVRPTSSVSEVRQDTCGSRAGRPGTRCEFGAGGHLPAHRAGDPHLFAIATNQPRYRRRPLGQPLRSAR